MTARIVATADNHLNRFTARLTVTRFEERRGRLRRAFRDVVDAAIEMKAVALVLGGDTFDTIDPRNLERAPFARLLRRLRDAGVTNATREGQEAGNSLRAGQAANTGITEERLGVGFGVEVAASLPAREAVATFAETVRRGATEARGDVAKLRGRANEVQSASAEAARMRRAIVGIERLIHAAHDATTDVENVARASDVQGFAEAALQASSAAARYSRSLALERLADLPTELDAATAKNHPGAVDSPPPVEAGGGLTSLLGWAGRPRSLAFGRPPQRIAEGFAQAARVADAVEARRVVDEQDHAERDADRARAAAQADAGTAWRAAAEAAAVLGMRMGNLPDDPTGVIDEIRRSVTAAHGFEPDRATAT